MSISLSITAHAHAATGEGRWPQELLEGWEDVDEIRDLPGFLLELHSMAALTTGKLPRLEAAAMASGEIANCYFVIALPRSEEHKHELDPYPEPEDIPNEELWCPDEFPRDPIKLKHDYHYVDVCCQVRLLSILYHLPLYFFLSSCAG